MWILSTACGTGVYILFCSKVQINEWFMGQYTVSLKKLNEFYLV